MNPQAEWEHMTFRGHEATDDDEVDDLDIDTLRYEQQVDDDLIIEKEFGQ